MKLSVCFEESSCILDLDIFKEKRLPKNVCDFAAAAKIQSKLSCARKSHCFYTWMLGSSSDTFKNICYSFPLLMWRFIVFLITLRLKFWCLFFFQTFPLRTGRTCCQTTPGRSSWLRPVTSWWSTWDWPATWKKNSVQPPPLPQQSRAGTMVTVICFSVTWKQFNEIYDSVIFCMVNCTLLQKNLILLVIF